MAINLICVKLGVVITYCQLNIIVTNNLYLHSRKTSFITQLFPLSIILNPLTFTLIFLNFCSFSCLFFLNALTFVLNVLKLPLVRPYIVYAHFFQGILRVVLTLKI